MSRIDATTSITEQTVLDRVVDTPALVRTRRLVGWAAQRRSLIQVVGPSGTGKTTATIDAAGEAVRALGVHAVRISVPHRPAPRLLALTLIEQITGENARGTLDQLESMLVHIIRDEHYLLIIDEAQNLNTGGIERLRTLWERAAFGGVFVGDTRLSTILGASPQLESRIERRIIFDPLTGADLFDFVRQLDPCLDRASTKDLDRVNRRCCRGNLRRWHSWVEALTEIRSFHNVTGPATADQMDAACQELG